MWAVIVQSCHSVAVPFEVTTIGSSGQISLGKQYAGRTVTVEETERGVWLIKTAQVIPDNERWLYTPEAKAKLDRALACSRKTKRSETDLAAIQKKLSRMK